MDIPSTYTSFVKKKNTLIKYVNYRLNTKYIGTCKNDNYVKNVHVYRINFFHRN